MGEIYKSQRWEVAGLEGSHWGVVFSKGEDMEEMVERSTRRATYYEDHQICNGYRGNFCLTEKVKKRQFINKWSTQVVDYNDKFNLKLTSSSSSSCDISHAYSHAQVTVKKKSKAWKLNSTTMHHLLWKA